MCTRTQRQIAYVGYCSSERRTSSSMSPTAPLPVPEQVELEPVGHLGVPAVHGLADGAGPQDHRLRLLRLSLEQRELRPVDARQPLLGGLLELGREPGHRLQLELGLADRAELEQRVQALLVRLHDALLVAELLRDRQQLGRELELADRVGGRMVGGDVALDGVGQRRGVVEAPGHRERLLAESGLALRREAGVAQRAAGQTGQQPDAKRAVGRAERGQRALEQRHEMLVVARDVPDDAAAVAERRAAEEVGQAVAVREVRGLAERRLRRARVARARPRLAHREQQLAADRRLVGQRQGQLVQAGGLLVGELRPPRDRPRGARSRRPGLRAAAAWKCCASSARCGSGSGACTASIASPACTCRLQALGRGQLVVERVADQRVPEAQPAGRSRDTPISDALGDRLVEHVEQLAERQAAEPREHIQPELPPEDRGRGEQRRGSARTAARRAARSPPARSAGSAPARSRRRSVPQPPAAARPPPRTAGCRRSRAWIARTRPDAGSIPARALDVARPPRPRRARSSRSAGRAARAATSASAGPSGSRSVGSTSRYAHTTSRRVAAHSRATNRSSSSDGSSAACRSSSTSTTGRSRVARRRNERHGLEEQEAGALGLGVRQLRGVTSRRVGLGLASSPAWPLSACTQGQYAGAPPASQQRPTRTAAPRERARRHQLVGEPALADPRLAGERARCARGPRAHRPPPRRARSARARGRRTRARCAPGPRRGRPARGSSDGSCSRIAWWSSRSGRPGSTPSSSTSAAARRLVRLERLGLAAAAVQREHQPAVHAAPAAAARRRASRARHDVGVAAGGEVGINPRARPRRAGAPPAARACPGRTARRRGRPAPARATARAPRAASGPRPRVGVGGPGQQRLEACERRSRTARPAAGSRACA